MQRTARKLLLAASGVCVAACGSTLAGTPVPVAGTVTGHIAAELATLLPDPGTFPAPYTAVVLSGPATTAAAADLTGVGPGARVRPDGCVPATPRAGDAAVVVGTDAASRATVTIELTRTTSPLTEVRDRLDRCAELTVEQRGATSTVRTAAAPAPRASADDTLALSRTVESRGAGTELRQSMSTQLGQIADVRVNATYMTFGPAASDTGTLDRLFAATLDRVRAAR